MLKVSVLFILIRTAVDVIQSVLSPSLCRLLRVVIGESLKCFYPGKLAFNRKRMKTIRGWPVRGGGGMDLA